MPNLMLTLRKGVREALGESGIRALGLDLANILCQSKLLAVSVENTTIPLDMDFVEVNELLVGVQVNGTCVHAKLEFDPGAHGFDLAFRPTLHPSTDAFVAALNELHRLQVEKDRLLAACKNITLLLIHCLKRHPLLQNLGVDVVSAQALDEWGMSEYELKTHVCERGIKAVLAFLLPLGKVIELPGFSGYHYHDSGNGYALLHTVVTKEGWSKLTVVAHVAEMPRSATNGYSLMLDLQDSPGQLHFQAFDDNGVAVFEEVPDGRYLLRIT